MALRQLSADEVLFLVDVEQDAEDVHTHMPRTGDELADLLREQLLLERLRHGDKWAWAWITVTVHWRNFQADACLGGCTFDDELDFLQSDAHRTLREQALASLQTTLQTAFSRLQELECAG